MLQRLVVVIALFGIADTLYLYTAHVRGDSLACNILDGCNVVAASPYSYLFGIPLSLLGLAFYISVLGIGVMLNTHHAQVAQKLLYGAAIVGLILSFCFSCIQVFLIGAFCIYCIFSAALCVALAVIAVVMWRRHRAHI